MAAEARRPLSREEYLALERRGERKHEYVAGERVAMVGASFRHNLIQTRILSGLYGQLRGRPCEVTSSDLRVAIGALGISTYPDITVVCGETQFEDGEQDTLLNPTLLVDILSPLRQPDDRWVLSAFEHLDDSSRSIPAAARWRWRRSTPAPCSTRRRATCCLSSSLVGIRASPRRPRAAPLSPSWERGGDNSTGDGETRH